MKKKLQLITHNKAVQKKLNVNLINYKLLSGKFLTHETKEKVKIYQTFTNFVIYDGEYLNGKKIGKAIEYTPLGRKKFEGEYKNGKRNGKGKEYYHNGLISFEGEYLNGKRWNIKEYDKNGNIIYELKEGKGHIIEYFSMIKNLKENI